MGERTGRSTDSEAATYVRRNLPRMVGHLPTAMEARQFAAMVDCVLAERSAGWRAADEEHDRAERAEAALRDIAATRCECGDGSQCRSCYARAALSFCGCLGPFPPEPFRAEGDDSLSRLLAASHAVDPEGDTDGTVIRREGDDGRSVAGRWQEHAAHLTNRVRELEAALREVRTLIGRHLVDLDVDDTDWAEADDRLRAAQEADRA